MDALPASRTPVLLMILSVSPVTLVARVEAETPLIDSIVSLVLSNLRKILTLAKAISPNCKSGKLSSRNRYNSVQPVAIGILRIAMLALLSSLEFRRECLELI